MGLVGMAPFQRDSLTGKFRIDWNAFLTLTLSFVISTGLGAGSAYVAIRTKIVEHDFRIYRLETDVNQYIKTTNEYVSKYSGDRKDIEHLCKEVKDIQDTVNAIRNDQIYRQKTK